MLIYLSFYPILKAYIQLILATNSDATLIETVSEITDETAPL